MQPKFDSAFAITALDGRNRYKLQTLATYFSDFILTKHRYAIELRYLIELSNYNVIRKLTRKENTSIIRLIEVFSVVDYRAIQKIEGKINHDVKAVEEYVKTKLLKTSLHDLSPMVHFGLTSDDLNSIAYASMTKDVLCKIILPSLKKIQKSLLSKSIQWRAQPMLGRTHGQPAVPTTVGKEILIYFKRLSDEILKLEGLDFRAKFSGNVGNFNAHQFIFPKTDWLKFSRDFISSFGLKSDPVTTQIQPYDSLINLFSSLVRINNILQGLAVDFWLYISQGYFMQRKITKEVGSSALPHKVNPIYFEGAEGGLGLANALFEFYIRKLSYSRLQRDLSDSIVRRSFGAAFGYSELSYQSIDTALLRLEINKDAIETDLNRHFEILSEPIQNFLRTKGYNDAYDKTKLFFRGKILHESDIIKFINSLNLKSSDKKELQKLNPKGYTGLAQKIVELYGR